MLAHTPAFVKWSNGAIGSHFITFALIMLMGFDLFNLFIYPTCNMRGFILFFFSFSERTVETWNKTNYSNFSFKNLFFILFILAFPCSCLCWMGKKKKGIAIQYAEKLRFAAINKPGANLCVLCNGNNSLFSYSFFHFWKCLMASFPYFGSVDRFIKVDPMLNPSTLQLFFLNGSFGFDQF